MVRVQQLSELEEVTLYIYVSSRFVACPARFGQSTALGSVTAFILTTNHSTVIG